MNDPYYSIGAMVLCVSAAFAASVVWLVVAIIKARKDDE